MKMMCMHNTIGNNTAIGNPEGGIVLMCMMSNYNTIERNNVSENTCYGIFIGGRNNTIRYNTANNNGWYGIHMGRSDGSYNNELYENTACGNVYADIRTCGEDCYGNHGDNNTCNTTSNYDDDGTTGCTYDCSPAPDFVITEKSEEWVDLTNKTYNLTYTVKNIGDADAGESNTSIRIDGAEVATDPVPQLPPDGVYTATVGTFTMSAVSDTIKICADRNYVIVEKSKEYNNCLESIFIYPELPDLVITEKSEEWIVEGSSYNITYTVTNIGNVDAGASNTSIRIDGAEVATDPVGILAAGDNHTNTLGPFTMAGVSDTIRICADSESVVGEGSEDNCLENIFWHEIADLVITDKFEEWVVSNETFNIYTITYTVTNIGTADANASNISIKIDGIVVATDPVGTLAPDRSYTSTTSPFTMSGENDTIVVCADNELAVIESDEDNNCLENTFEYSEVGCVASDGTVFRCGNTVTRSCTFNGDVNCSTTRYGLVIGADDITIDGAGYALGRAGPGECAFCPSAGILNKGYDDVAMTNLEIKHFCTGVYLDIDYESGNVVYRNTIENCNIHHNGNATAPSATHGIKMRYVWSSTIRNNSVHDQIAHVNPNPGCEDGGNGLFLYTGDHNNIIGNRFYNNQKAGMLIKMKPKYWNISHNHLWGNGQGGIILRCKLCDFNLIEHNNASDNYGSGIFIGGNDNIIRYNTVCNNMNGGPYYEDSGIGGSGYGINIGRSDGSLDNALISNTVCGNDYLDMRVVTGVTGNTGDCNTCNTTENYDDTGTTGCAHSCGTTQLLGDLNGDDMITPADAAIALQMTVRGEYSIDADVSGDRMVTSLDALMILQAAAGV
jgi:parallel beta-helix repeat protein